MQKLKNGNLIYVTVMGYMYVSELCKIDWCIHKRQLIIIIMSTFL